MDRAGKGYPREASARGRHASPLEDRLTREMAGGRLISYESFLKTVLYDERHGYYRTGKQERRDYSTSPEIHRLFGRTIGRYIEDLCDRIPVPGATILELGGASGGLAADIVSALTHLRLDAYVVLEKGREKAEGPIRWITSLDRLGAVDGFTFVVANEFFDALPFHRVIRQKGRIEEIYVGCGDGFFDRTGPLSTDVASFIRKYPIFLQENQVSEVTTAAEPLIGAISGLVERGCLLIFDYGYHQADIAAGRFFHGSMVGYKERVMREDVFDSLGQMDITHHVNFDHLSALLGEKGWRKDGEIEQYRFLCNAGMLEALAGLGQGERISAKWLINPEGLGSMISVLGFSRNLPQTLPGFRRAG